MGFCAKIILPENKAWNLCKSALELRKQNQYFDHVGVQHSFHGGFLASSSRLFETRIEFRREQFKRQIMEGSNGRFQKYLLSSILIQNIRHLYQSTLLIMNFWCQAVLKDWLEVQNNSCCTNNDFQIDGDSNVKKGKKFHSVTLLALSQASCCSEHSPE